MLCRAFRSLVICKGEGLNWKGGGAFQTVNHPGSREYAEASVILIYFIFKKLYYVYK
jgi:hypothetical protein